MNQPLSITIAHLNDTHSYFEPSSLQLNMSIDGRPISPYVSAGGFARIATRVEQLRTCAAEQQRGFLFLHAGDCFQGTLYFSLFKGKANADLLNTLGIDAMTVGNHELDLGNDILASFARQIQFPLLGGNWDLSREKGEKKCRLSDRSNVYSYQPQSQTAQWIVREFNQESVAIFGLSLDRMADIANPDPDTPFVLSTNVAENTVKAIQAAGINKIILLSHLGYDADKQLAEKVSGISLIIGGHSHVLQGDFSDLGLESSDDYGVKINHTYIVQSGMHSLVLGHCHIDFNASGEVTHFTGKNELLIGRRLFHDAARESQGQDTLYQQAHESLTQHPLIAVCHKHPSIQEILYSRYLPLVRRQQIEKITILNESLRHVRIPDSRGGSEVAPLVARAFTYTMRKRGHPVQFGIHNAGGVRCSLPPGPLTVADVSGNLLPFALPVCVYYVTGATMKKMLEGAIDNALDNGVIGTGAGSYPYCYGLDFIYDADKSSGERISQLKIYNGRRWEPVGTSAVYCGTSSAYTMKGKEGYNAILDVVRSGYTSDVTMADAFIEMLRESPHILQDYVTATRQAQRRIDSR
jgi:5'-nucleotidase